MLLNLGHRIGTTGSQRQNLGIDGRHVVGRHANDAGCRVVGRSQCSGRCAVAVVVVLDLLNRRIGCSHQGLHFRCAVRTASGLSQHLRVDSGQVFCSHTCDAGCFVVLGRQGRWRGAVAIVVRLDLGQGCGARSHQSLHLSQRVCTTCGLRQHLSVDGSQVLCSHPCHPCRFVVGHRQSSRRGAVAVVVRLDLGQGGGLCRGTWCTPITTAAARSSSQARSCCAQGAQTTGSCTRSTGQNGTHRRRRRSDQIHHAIFQHLQLTALGPRPLVTGQEHIFLSIEICQFNQFFRAIFGLDDQIFVDFAKFDLFGAHQLVTRQIHTIQHHRDFFTGLDRVLNGLLTRFVFSNSETGGVLSARGDDLDLHGLDWFCSGYK